MKCCLSVEVLDVRFKIFTVMKTQVMGFKIVMPYSDMVESSPSFPVCNYDILCKKNADKH